ncbi:TetR/AcrR family transcriptional regulator [Nocardioides zeae]|uniref:TetR/AcrR family transcriptional regulator n=1 Tax=Nocardioides imazamoxiresistens TaxID=3231893 RepID=A0ABU3PYD8_9ACTN|nr:TetR/AcrR family transcriptional regulator [Nocardioides zeae]MDT9594266.1 TetR/AcrR family transcriptional regulator [Nocardioides zeae]
MTATTTRTSPVRSRILTAARRRFYVDGIRAVSADRLIADAEVSKMTFYRHFRSKDDLVVAYLGEFVTEERAAMAESRAAHAGDPAAVLRAYAERIGTLSCVEGFRGCAFLNAAAEYADPTHPVRGVVQTHRAWLRGELADLLIELGVSAGRAERAADELQMLRDGAMVAGTLDGRPTEAAASLVAAGEAVVRAALRPGA